MKNFNRLKERQRNERKSYPENHALRVHRSLSWLKKAEACEGDDDAQFIFLWISFNAAYACDVDRAHRIAEHQTFDKFIGKLCGLDSKGCLSKLVWQEFAGAIRLVLDNEYVFQPFWDYQNGHISELQWKERFNEAKGYANKALGNENTTNVLAIVFDRIYTLRNQLLHGGATHNSKVNREQMRDCCHLMGKIIPAIIEIMMDNPDTLWGDAHYPVVIN
ncbi:HEPN domain-containing protein [uncultured Psychromonas sp.]|uniref:HEPN domain-containing protein n=1 Tax=uncultured Psychromonas sp. TaxID=173974 RepID=UPI00260227A5|nr:HEPN domain-containing protein [uncultured Psychromonas sp.]